MRENKYRGIDFDTDKWLYGSLVQPHPGKTEAIWHQVEGVGNQINMIKPGTSGQYTGLKDKNGKEIYEGDIVTYLDGNEWSTENGYDCEEFLNRGVINFDTEYARFDVTNKESADYEEIFEGGGDFEVIGNIHDNPELLEEKQ